MKRSVAAGLIAGLIAGCHFIPGTDANYIDRGKEILLNNLVDAQTARFRNVRIHRPGNAPGLRFVCGEVNPRSSIGGFSGFHRFLANPETADWLIDVETGVKAAMAERARETCVQSGEPSGSACVRDDERAASPSAGDAFDTEWVRWCE